MAVSGSRILPPRMDETTFIEALDAIAAIIGKENVSYTSIGGALEGPHGQRHYGDVYEMRDKDSHTPSGAVRPSMVEEVRAVLRVANKYKLPLWTLSRGKNLGYGGSALVVRGTVVLDLHRMNKIIEVNHEYAYAVVEPGVSFFDLFEYIDKNDYNLWPSVPALGWGSVLGNVLERGFGYTPNGEHSQQQCGMEIVLSNGEIVRTGMWAKKDCTMGPLFKGGYGPGIDSLFYQSNLGVVTKLGIHMTPAPTHYMDCSVSVPGEADLGILNGTLSRLQRESVIMNHPTISNLFRQMAVSEDPAILQQVLAPGSQGGHASRELLDRLNLTKERGFWKGMFAIYGPSKAAVDTSWESVQDAFEGVPGVKFGADYHEAKRGQRLKIRDMPEFEIPHNGFPRLSALPMMDTRGYGGGHICFSPLFPPGGKELYEWYKFASQRISEENFDLFADFHCYGRYTIAIVVMVYGPTEGRRADALYEELMVQAHEEHQTSEYRTHIDYMSKIASHFDFNDGALNKFVTGLKELLDPNGILSQGKSGIWSTRYDKVDE